MNQRLIRALQTGHSDTGILLSEEDLKVVRKAGPTFPYLRSSPIAPFGEAGYRFVFLCFSRVPASALGGAELGWA